MTRSKDSQEDERREAGAPSRVTKTHGGQTVESIAPEDLESLNDAECKHEKLVRDETETDYNAFVCANPKCSEVVLFSKD
jgi:hypothetical protein